MREARVERRCRVNPSNAVLQKPQAQPLDVSLDVLQLFSASDLEAEERPLQDIGQLGLVAIAGGSCDCATCFNARDMDLCSESGVSSRPSFSLSRALNASSVGELAWFQDPVRVEARRGTNPIFGAIYRNYPSEAYVVMT